MTYGDEVTRALRLREQREGKLTPRERITLYERERAMEGDPEPVWVVHNGTLMLGSEFLASRRAHKPKRKRKHGRR